MVIMACETRVLTRLTDFARVDHMTEFSFCCESGCPWIVSRPGRGEFISCGTVAYFLCHWL
jgi:hypothetical protein